MAENDQKNGNGEGEDARATRVLTDIAPRAWEHPADRAALAALRKIPVFDDILRKLFGFFGERPIRLGNSPGFTICIEMSFKRWTRPRTTLFSSRRRPLSTQAPTEWTIRSSF